MTIEVAEGVVDAEIVPTQEEARQSVKSAKGLLDGFWSEIKWQVKHKAWESLGYQSLNEMWNAEYASMNVGISRAERPELVGALRSAGQTQREIADKLGVERRTVIRDSQSDICDIENATITNSRGQERPATYSTDAKPRATPLPQQFSSATVDLERVMSRFRRISDDTNFNSKNKQSISETHLSDLDRAIKQLTELRNQLEGETK